MKKTANTGSTAVELEKELGMSEEELFSFAEYHPEEAERTGYSEYSYWKSVFRSFRKNKAAVIMIVVFIAIFIFSYVALVIGKYDYHKQEFLHLFTGRVQPLAFLHNAAPSGFPCK